MNPAVETSSSSPRGFESFMARISGSGRTAVERHLDACAKAMTPGHVRLWKQLVGLLGRLTPDALPVPAARAVRFYVPDGKYKRQVFAFEDLRDGKLALYLDDTRATAFQEGVLVAQPGVDSNLYPIGVGSGAAIRITLETDPTAGQVRAAEPMCIIAAGAPRPS